jgi:hypothetical protein
VGEIAAPDPMSSLDFGHGHVLRAHDFFAPMTMVTRPLKWPGEIV